MKLNEKVSLDDKLLHVQQTHDVRATLKRAEMMRHAHEAGQTGGIPADWVPLGVVPGIMQRIWAEEAGVRMDDSEAMDEVLNKKLMSGEFAKFRVSDKT